MVDQQPKEATEGGYSTFHLPGEACPACLELRRREPVLSLSKYPIEGMAESVIVHSRLPKLIDIPLPMVYSARLTEHQLSLYYPDWQRFKLRPCARQLPVLGVDKGGWDDTIVTMLEKTPYVCD